VNTVILAAERHKMRKTLQPDSRALVSVVGLVGLFVAAGCSFVPDPKADPTRFYVLSASAAPAAGPRGQAPTVQLRPIELASYLRSRALIVRRGEHEIQFREFAHWGEPLDLAIGRVLREELLARGAAAVVSGPASRSGAGLDRALNVRVLACEGGADGAVIFRAVWELATTGDQETRARGDFRASDLRWDGKNEAMLAAGLSQAVAGLAAEIAPALGKTD
jgi:uncharacterized protein